MGSQYLKFMDHFYSKLNHENFRNFNRFFLSKTNGFDSLLSFSKKGKFFEDNDLQKSIKIQFLNF